MSALHPDAPPRAPPQQALSPSWLLRWAHEYGRLTPGLNEMSGSKAFITAMSRIGLSRRHYYYC